jgi:hypothetical protein
MSHPNGLSRRPQAIISDLYETLVTESDPQWVPCPSVAERLGVSEVAFSAVWAKVWDRRMTGKLQGFAEALREICCALGHEPNESAIRRLHQERLATKARPFLTIEPSITEMIRRLHRMSVRLTEPTIEVQDEFPDMVHEWLDQEGRPAWNGALDDFAAFGQRVLGEALPEKVTLGWVSCTHVWLITCDSRIVGTSRLRHWLVPQLEREGGHIGCDARPLREEMGLRDTPDGTDATEGSGHGAVACLGHL